MEANHWVAFGSIKVANLCLFQALDPDMLICMRACQYYLSYLYVSFYDSHKDLGVILSWQNLAYRVMSTLNFALQNVLLACSKMTDAFEAFTTRIH